MSEDPGDWGSEKFDAAMKKAYAKEKLLKNGSVEGTVKGVRPSQLPKDDLVFKITAYEKDKVDHKIVRAYNKLLRASGIVNHFVLEDSTGIYVCVGITFPDGHYEQLDETIPETQILKHVFEQ